MTAAYEGSVTVVAEGKKKRRDATAIGLLRRFQGPRSGGRGLPGHYAKGVLHARELALLWV